MFDVEQKIAGVWTVRESFPTFLSACHFASFLSHRTLEHLIQIIDPEGEIISKDILTYDWSNV
jgi:hypothetical protein